MPGSLTTPGRPGARDDAPGCVAFRHLHGVGTQNRNLSRLNGWPMRPPVNASPSPSRGRRMTRGQCGSLDLHWERLALSTPCRSPGASQMFSALPLKADIEQRGRHVRLVPTTEVTLIDKLMLRAS